MPPTPVPLPLPLTTAMGSRSCTVAPKLGFDTSRCVLGENLGCFEGERKMWLVAPCHGTFVCDGFELQCKASRISEKPGRRHNCMRRWRIRLVKRLHCMTILSLLHDAHLEIMPSSQQSSLYFAFMVLQALATSTRHCCSMASGSLV